MGVDLQPRPLMDKNQENHRPIPDQTPSSASSTLYHVRSSTRRAPSPLPPNAAITKRYLTFSTTLPPAHTTLSSTDNDLGPLPPVPDLTPYADPQSWPRARKHVLLALFYLATFLTAYTSGSYSPPQHLIRNSLEPRPSLEAVLAGITTFCLGFALAPMALAPLSEMNGRYPVFVVAGTVYVFFQAVCGFVTNVEGMLAARFLVGVGGSVFSSMVGGVIADMYGAAERNTPMALFSGFVLAGTGAGPLVAAVMADRLGGTDAWKWIWWHQVVAGGLTMVALVLLFKESRGGVVLSRRARRLNQWYEELEKHGYVGVWMDAEDEDPTDGEKKTLSEAGKRGTAPDDEENISASTTEPTLRRIRWVVKEDEERASLGRIIATSVSRPFHLLLTEPIVFFFSLWVSFAWGVLYLTFGSIPLVFQRQYAWTLEQSGYIFTSLIIGAVLATALGIWQESALRHPRWANDTPIPDSRTEPLWSFLRRRFPASAPESRLYFTCLTSTLLPLGLFVFGLTARPDVHWAAPATGLVFATMGILAIYLSVFNYFADAYHQYASSALAAQSFCRNVVGGAFPLVTGLLFNSLGEAKAGATLGAIAALLTVVPWVLVLNGEKIRARSRFACQLKI